MTDLAAFVGVPYVGRHFCRVFARNVLAAHGVPFPTARAARIDWQRVERARLFDVVVFNVKGKPGHVGVMLGPSKFLHVEEGSTSRIEHLSPLRQVEGFYRYTGTTTA